MLGIPWKWIVIIGMCIICLWLFSRWINGSENSKGFVDKLDNMTWEQRLQFFRDVLLDPEGTPIASLNPPTQQARATTNDTTQPIQPSVCPVEEVDAEEIVYPVTRAERSECDISSEKEYESLNPLHCAWYNMSKGQYSSCVTLSLLFNKEFKSYRLKSMINPYTKKALELDCYNPQVGIAVEYQGEQHYRFPNGFHKTREEFEDQVARDVIKEHLCKKNNILLIKVPYTVPLDVIPSYIYDRLPEEKKKACKKRRALIK